MCVCVHARVHVCGGDGMVAGVDCLKEKTFKCMTFFFFAKLCDLSSLTRYEAQARGTEGVQF